MGSVHRYQSDRKGAICSSTGNRCDSRTNAYPQRQKIGPVEVAIAASVGISTLLVEAMPSIGIISTGDEIIPIEQQPLPHQIRSSNSIMIEAVLKQKGFQTEKKHVLDEPAAMEKYSQTYWTRRIF